jgi:hypothetical protein
LGPLEREGGERVRRIYPPALGIFLILLGSFAFYWHSRDWNTASRLMLTYAMVDRGTVLIDGLDRQTEDKALFRGHYYSDKLPGYSLMAALPYACAKWAFNLLPHPLGAREMPYWAADYWITLCTSGLLTACTGILLVLMARDLGCSPGSAALVGLAYGLATPAYVYATLAYGHQASAFALLASFRLIWKAAPRWEGVRLAAAGFLAAWASVIELQMGPVSAILGLYLFVEVLRKRYRPRALATFALGALIPTVALFAYNILAFGSPFEMGYFYEKNFRHVHTRANPLGLRPPDWGKLGPLLVGRYRGLLCYAPILVLALPGWIVLLLRRCWALPIVSFFVCASVLLVNLSYPEWTGGWSTGPRLLVPLIPFAMIPVAGLLAESGNWHISVTFAAAGLAAIGGIEILLFQGAGGRIPHGFSEPFTEAIWPLWTGQNPHPGWRMGERFCRNAVSEFLGDRIARLGPAWEPIQFLPLVLVQFLAIGALCLLLRRSTEPRAADPPLKDLSPIADHGVIHGSHLGIDEQQDGRRRDKDPHDPEAEPEGVPPDPLPGLVA